MAVRAYILMEVETGKIKQVVEINDYLLCSVK